MSDLTGTSHYEYNEEGELTGVRQVAKFGVESAVEPAIDTGIDLASGNQVTGQTVAMNFAFNLVSNGAGSVSTKKAPKVNELSTVKTKQSYDSSFDKLNSNVNSMDLPEGTWSKNHFDRGKDVDNMLNNVGSNYPVIDRFENGVATSVKSRDLNAKTYQSGSKLQSVIKRDVDKLANFEGIEWNRLDTRESIIQKNLDIVVPDVPLSNQQITGFNNAIDYANSKNVEINVIVGLE